MKLYNYFADDDVRIGITTFYLGSGQYVFS